MPYVSTIPRDPNIQITPKLGPDVCKSYLYWATWIPTECRVSILGTSSMDWGSIPYMSCSLVSLKGVV